VFRLLAETGLPLEGALPEEIAAVEAWRPTNIPAWKAKLAWEQTDSAVATAPEVDVVTVPQTEGLSHPHLTGAAMDPTPPPTLRDYQTGAFLRDATPAESEASKDAATRDGGVGVILVDGRPCYVQD
jgi:hypothetical protein